jgi:hypothetical protein
MVYGCGCGSCDHCVAAAKRAARAEHQAHIERLARLDAIWACRVFDIPPWLIGLRQRPLLAGLRWRLRRIIPAGVWR